MSKKLLILGAKSVARKALEAIEGQGLYSEIALLDNYPDTDRVFSYPIIGKCDDLEKFAQHYTHAFVCITDTRTRRRFLQKLEEMGLEIPNIIHPHAYVSKSAFLGKGILVNALAGIQSFSKIGDGCIIETGAIVEHDNELGECVFMAPNSSTTGNIKIGSATFVGSCSCVINRVSIGENVLIAAGSTVISDVPGYVMVAGCPAKIKKPITEMNHLIWPSIYPKNGTK